MVAALSAGLVASTAMPAHAAPPVSTGVSSVDTSAASTLALAPMSTGRSGLIASPGLARNAVIAAPSAATVTFETGGVKAVPQPGRPPGTVAHTRTKSGAGAGPARRSPNNPNAGP